MSRQVYAVDTETTGLQYWAGDYPFLITICDEKGRTALARRGPARPQDGAYTALTARLSQVQAAPGPRPEGKKEPVNWALTSSIPEIQTMFQLREMLGNPFQPKVYHNAKFDIPMLRSAGFMVNGLPHDTMILARLLMPDAPSVGLKNLARWLLKADTSSETAIKDYMKHNHITNYEQIPPEVLHEYALDDVRYTITLFKGFITRMTDNLNKVYMIERRLIEIIIMMESRGMLLDMNYVKENAQVCRQHQDTLQEEIDTIAGYPINVNSPKQLSELLFERLRLQDTLTPDQLKRFGRILKTDKGAWSTQREVLRIYDHPIVHLIMEFRMYGKMAGTYFERFTELAGSDNVLHASFWQAGTQTGRFSSSDPSFQTIPSITSGRLLDFDRDKIPNVRRAFINRPGFQMYAPDYSQIELRIAACYAQEEVMMQAFIDGRDIHDETTKAIFPDDWMSADDPTKVDKPKRTFCKMVNFGVIYGMGVGKLSADLGVPYERAKMFLDKYFKTYPKLHELMQQCQRDIATKGYVENIFGRRAKPGIQLAYKGLNFLVQGTAADLVKITMTRMVELFRALDVEAYLLNTVHDEILFEIKIEHDTPEFHKRLKQVMEDWPQFNPVPIPVKCKKVVGYWSNHEEVW